jgi:hypothetical protein
MPLGDLDRYLLQMLNSATMIQHFIDREMLMRLYIGLKLHSAIQKQKIIDKFFKLGLSISHDHVTQISSKTTNSICEFY